jgi:hypothetical protein
MPENGAVMPFGCSQGSFVAVLLQSVMKNVYIAE